MKGIRPLILLFLCTLLSLPLIAQRTDQHLYRLYVTDFRKIRDLERIGVNIYNRDPGNYIEIMALPEQVEGLRNEGFHIEYLGANFQELPGAGRLKAAPEYHDYQETMDELADLAGRYPDIADLSIIGTSVLGRDIACLKISDQVQSDEDEIPILICGNHHGNEVLSVEATLYQLNYILSNYGTDPEVTDWVDRYEIWFIPMLNPDGREAVRRTNENGIDLNRNYGFEHTLGGNHGEPFSEPETRAIRDFVADHPPALSLTYHTSGRYVLYSWTHTDDGAPDSTAMIYLGNKIAESIVFPQGASTGHYTLLQGGRWYFTAGEYCDYLYSTFNTLAFTVEMWTQQNPDPAVIPQVVERNLEGFKTLLRQASKSGVTGKVTDKLTGEAVVVEVSIPSINNQNKLSPRLSEPVFGRYYRYLAPGNYQLKFSATGYRDKLVDVAITEEGLTQLDIQMESGPLLVLAESRLTDPDGQINIGEIGSYIIGVQNLNEIAAENTRARVRSMSPYLQVLTDSLYFGRIEGLQTQTSADSLRFTIDPDCPDGTRVGFKIEMADDQGVGWVLDFSDEVHAPDLEILWVRVLDSLGNGNGVFEAGESVQIDLRIRNQGRQSLHALVAQIETEEQELTIRKDLVESSQLETGSELSLLFELNMSFAVGKVFIGNLKLQVNSQEGYHKEFDFQLNNIRGFFDNFELGNQGWVHDSYRTTSNHHDDWQLGTPAGKAGDPTGAFSGINCWGTDLGLEWYDNDTWNGEYQSSVYNYLRSPVIDCSEMRGVGLQYQRLLTTLNNDVGSIRINDSLVWSSSRRGLSDGEWTLHELDISGIADGNSKVQVVFELQSNNNSNAGGWNIDDVIVAAGLYQSTGLEEPYQKAEVQLSCYPNPFLQELSIGLSLPGSSPVRIEIIDSFGRLVWDREESVLHAGMHEILWNGQNSQGTQLAAGIYLVRARTGSGTASSLLIKR